MYATDDIFAHAIKYLGSYKRALVLSAALYAKRLYTRAPRYRVVYEESGVESNSSRD